MEALSVTPFSPTSLDRGIEGMLVSAARVADAHDPDGLSPERHAGHIKARQDRVEELIERLVGRVGASVEEQAAHDVKERLRNRLGQWLKRRDRTSHLQRTLVYERIPNGKEHDFSALIGAEEERQIPDSPDTPPFRVPNSMREVQPEINLLVSPLEDRLVYEPPVGAPTWEMPGGTKGSRP